MPNQVRVGVGVTGAKGASSELDQLRDRFAKLQSQGAKGFGIGVGAAVTTAALNAVGNAVGDVTGFLSDSVTAYRNAEESQARLSASLRENITGWNGNKDAMMGAIQASEKLGFTNTEAADSLALLVGATHDQAKAMDMLGVAENYARFKNVDLLQAATDLTKVEGGSTRALKALGINLHTGATEAERMGAIMKVVGGQAQAFAETDLGKLAAANEKVNEAQVKLGASMSKVGAVVMPAAADALSTFVDGVQGAGVATGNMIADFYEWEFGAKKASEATDTLSGKVEDDLTPSVIHLAAGSNAAADKIHLLYKKEQDAIDATKKLDGALKALDDAMFGSAEAAGHIAQAQQDLADVLKQEPQKHSGREWTIWQGKVAEARQALFDLQFQEKQTEGPKALLDWLKKQRAGLKDAKSDAALYLDKLIEIARVSATMPRTVFTVGSGSTGVKHFATGGRLAPGEHAEIGEDGPEDLYNEGGMAVVVPRSGNKSSPGRSAFGRSGGAGLHGAAPVGDTHFHINISGVEVLTPGAAEELARRLEPVITRAQQRRGHVAAARAF